MSEFYGEASRDDAIATLRHAVELGVTLFDTADMYGQGENERLVGEALGADRERVTIATKFGLVRDSEGAFTGVNGRPEYAREACEASLRRLGVDVIDLYQLHRADPEVPIEETVGGMQELVEAGKVRRIGLSEVSAEQIRRAAEVASIATVQSEYSLLERGVEAEVLPECDAHGIAFMPFAPLMRGLIARRFTSVEELDDSDTRRRGSYPRLSGDALEKNLELAQLVWEIADGRGATPAQVAIAWLLSRSPTVIPIPGTRSVKRLEENLGAQELDLTADELTRLDAVVGPAGHAEGDRLPRRPHNRAG
jgi:aryl-alcohol dehydrogenase-like predicted oxidoreductase